MIKVTDWDSKDSRSSVSYEIPKVVETIEICYDRGRFYLYINGSEVFSDTSGMSDFNVLINNQED